MKKSFGIRLLLVCLLLLTMLNASYAVADDVGADDRNPSNDIVIVLDQSNSMSNADPQNRRLDAAQMIVGMCDMENSRVAIIPFAGKIQASADMGFVPINEAESRLNKMNAISGLTRLVGDTDLGNALNLAVKLLLEREDKTNNPMIIALTDGENSFLNNADSDDIYLWDRNSNTYQKTKVYNYGATVDNAKSNNGVKINAETQQNNAMAAAKANGIPIYTVALKDPQKKDTQYIDGLRNLSDQTNGDFHLIDIQNDGADTLPRIFGEMFASQIGSSLLEQLSPQPVSGAENRYSVNLPILNQSVLEANVYIPLATIDATTLRLYDAGGTDRTRGATDVVYLESDNFVLYKICSPRTLGNWTLEFSLKEDAASVSSISFSLLYNYDITFKTRVGNTSANLQEPGAGLTVGKNEHLFISSSFYELDDATQTEVPSRDMNLYAVRDGDEWETIRATCELRDAHGNLYYTGQMISDEVRQFTLDINLPSACQTGEGFNSLRAGAYQLTVKVEGAGLRRENNIALDIVNNAPVQLLSGSERILVNDPSDPATTSVQQGVPLNLASFVSDPDNDKLVCQFSPQNNADAILKVYAVEQEDGTVEAFYDTVMDTTAGKIKSGTAEYILTVTDSPDGTTLTIPFTFDVVSVADSTMSAFQCATTVSGVDTDGTADKNSDIVFEMSLKNTDGTPDHTGAIQGYSGHIYINDAVGAGRVADIEMLPDKTGAKLVGVYHTGNAGASLSAVCTYKYGEYAVPQQDATFDIVIPNSAPVPDEEVLKALTTTYTCDPLPAFLSFLETPTPQEERTLDLTQLFVDADHEAGLIYADPVLKDEAGNTVSSLAVNRSDTLVVITASTPGSAVLTLSATDGDGETATIHLSIRSVSLIQKWLMILVIAIIAVVLLFILYMVTRPRFFRGIRLSVYANNTLTPYQYAEGIGGQKAVSLGRYVNEPLALQDAGVTLEDLNQLSIKPMRGKAKSVSLMRTSRKNTVSPLVAQLEGVTVSGKPIPWKTDAELTLRHSPDSANFMRIVLEVEEVLSAGSNADSAFSDDAGAFGGQAAQNHAQTDFDTPEDW